MSFTAGDGVSPAFIGIASSKTPFETARLLTSNIMMPPAVSGGPDCRLGALSGKHRKELVWERLAFNLWRGLVRYVVPLAIVSSSLGALICVKAHIRCAEGNKPALHVIARTLAAGISPGIKAASKSWDASSNRPARGIRPTPLDFEDEMQRRNSLTATTAAAAMAVVIAATLLGSVASRRRCPHPDPW